VTARYEKAEDLLRDKDIQVVSIASYDRDHHAHVITALENGKHVFVEKPMCVSTQEARSIRNALSRFPKSKISSNLILRRSPLFMHMKQMVEQGLLGSLYHVEGDYLYGRLEKITKGWRGESTDYSVTLGGGVHVIDLLMWLSCDRVESVQAIGGRRATAGTKVMFPDTVAALLTFTSGMTGVVSTNFPCVHPHFHRMALFGDKGTLRNDTQGATWFKERDKHECEVLSQAYRPASKHLIVSEFAKSLRGESAGCVDIEDVFSVLSVCFAIDEAIKTKATVKVTYL
jgi:predicted dehydrogenase